MIRLDPTLNRTFYYWHLFVPHLGAGQLYGYRVYGPFEPQKGHRFDPSKLLIELMGDEVGRGQKGNNNVYCQNNELSWFDWRGVEQNADMLRFVKGLIHFNRAHPLFQQRSFWTIGADEHLPRITWHGTRLHEPDLRHESRTLAFSLHDTISGEDLHIMLNAYWEPLSFELPPLPAAKQWHQIIDTARPSPEDFCDAETAPPVTGSDYLAEARSSVVLVARSGIVIK